MNEHNSEPSSETAPLQLTQVTVRRFRCLHDVGPLPVQRGLTVLAGENGGGKTTFIDAITFLLGVGKQAIANSDRSNGTEEGEPIEVEGSFCAINDPECCSPLILRAHQALTGERAWEVRDQIHSGFGGRPADLTLNELRARMQGLGIASPGGSAKVPIVAAAEAWIATRPAEEFEACWRQVTKGEQERLPALTRFDSASAPSPTATIQKIIQRDIQLLLADEPYAPQLNTLGQALDTDIQPRLQRFMDMIAQHCTELDSVVVKTQADFSKPTLKVQLEVHRQGEIVDLEKEGEGDRRRIALAIHEADQLIMEAETAPSASMLLVYDEPDSHLDYAHQRKLTDILERQAKIAHVQVVVATHSHKLIDRVPLNFLLHFRLHGGRRSQVEAFTGRGHQDELNFMSTVLAGLGLRTSTLLDERCFLVIEGKTEWAALPGLFQLSTGQSLVTAGVSLLSTQGSGSVRRIVDTLVEEWKREVILLADSDARSEHEVWAAGLGLLDGDGAYYLGASEFEDAFEDEVWLRALQASFPTNDGTPWHLAEIAELRSKEGKYSYHLCSLVKRRHDNAIGKPDLGFALAAVCTEADVPLQLRACLERAQEVAERLGD